MKANKEMKILTTTGNTSHFAFDPINCQLIIYSKKAFRQPKVHLLIKLTFNFRLNSLIFNKVFTDLKIVYRTS